MRGELLRLKDAFLSIEWFAEKMPNCGLPNGCGFG